jgi:hypothetical protein
MTYIGSLNTSPYTLVILPLPTKASHTASIVPQIKISIRNMMDIGGRQSRERAMRGRRRREKAKLNGTYPEKQVVVIILGTLAVYPGHHMAAPVGHKSSTWEMAR